MKNSTPITVETVVNADIAKTWQYFTEPEHIIKWNFASDDWHCPSASNDLTVGGNFSYTMAAKDGSFSFDFGGTYSNIIPHQLIEYTIGDGRKVSVQFSSANNQTTVTETFDAENIHSPEMQQQGWQAILNNLKKHVELD